MFSSLSLAFILGLIAGVILGYFVRDFLRLMARFVRHMIFRPSLLTVSKPHQSGNGK